MTNSRVLHLSQNPGDSADALGYLASIGRDFDNRDLMARGWGSQAALEDCRSLAWRGMIAGRPGAYPCKYFVTAKGRAYLAKIKRVPLQEEC